MQAAHTNLSSNQPPLNSANASISLKVIKRSGQVVDYDDSKIAIAITKAFLAVEGNQAAISNRIHETVEKLTKEITSYYEKIYPSESTLYIEDIQDRVELTLMRHEAHKVARTYVLYREAHRQAREQKAPKPQPILHIRQHDGSLQPLDQKRLSELVKEACVDLAEVEADRILVEAQRNLFDGAHISDINKVLILAARTLIEQEPNYTYVTARLLLDQLRTEALSFLDIRQQATYQQMYTLYPEYFLAYIEKGIQARILDPRLQTFDLKRISQALEPSRDLQFTYLSLQTLYDRYFLHYEEVRYELPQAFFMRIAMGLALNEADKEARAIEFYHLLSSFDFMSSTPTLFNSGTVCPQLSSCFLTTVPDDLDAIYSAIKDNALLSKFAGGLGNDWTPVRATGARIKGTNGKSLGVIPFMNVANASAIAVNQGGKRKGAVCAYLETWHLDIEEFLELRKNTGDERRRTHDMNTANWIPDLFMKRVFNDEQWTLFSPDEVSDLHDLYGQAFEQAYMQYEEEAILGKIKNYKTISAIKLWRKMLSLLFETGHPWITFKDPCNLRSPQSHAGVIHSSNLCTEITLNTSAEEVAVCNLGSINLPAHIDNKTINQAKLKQTIATAIRMLDNVIDINHYSIPQAKHSNLRHRPIGLGLMGFQDMLYKMELDYSSLAAVQLADYSMELISYYAIAASNQLAKERGAYPTFTGSLWSQGILPIDSIQRLRQARGEFLEQDEQSCGEFAWETLRHEIQQSGMRNSNVLAIAPTATIANICGISPSIEPTYQNLYVKSNLSGEFTVVNPYLVQALKALDLWDEVMVNDLKYFNGSVQAIDRIPADLKRRFATSFELDPIWLVEAASRRQKWLDQSQSLNLYMAQPSGKKLDELYKLAWLRGLKTCYYLRSLGATSTEKATLHDATLNAVKITEPKTCAIDDPECEACQ